MRFDLEDLRRILAIVKRDGDAALSADDREVHEEWVAFCRECFSSITTEQVQIFEIFDRLPTFITEPFQDWAVKDLAVMWPLLREEFMRAGVDVEAAERGAAEEEAGP